MPLSIVIIMFPEFCSLLSPHLVTSKTWIICEYMRDGCPQRDSQLKTDSPLRVSWMSTESESWWQHKRGVDCEKTFGKEMTNICYLHSEFLKYDTSKIRKNIHKISTREVLYNKMKLRIEDLK